VGKNFIDLFCGAGGLSLGFERAGYRCVGAIDVSKACIDTHKLNFLIVFLLTLIFQRLNLTNLKKKLEIKKYI